MNDDDYDDDYDDDDDEEKKEEEEGKKEKENIEGKERDKEKMAVNRVPSVTQEPFHIVDTSSESED